MLNISNRAKIYLILFHVMLGFILSNFRFISTYYGLGIIIIGTYLSTFTEVSWWFGGATAKVIFPGWE